jgi:hypothetical protein
MSLVLQSSGGGQITIQEPTTASNFTATLPAADGTIVVSGTTPTLNGITFPATQVPSADANTLDDYEEGTFTPTFTASTAPTSVTYSTQVGIYQKIGNKVFIEISLTLTSKGSGGSGNVTISNLPFAANNVTGYFPNFGCLIDSLNSDCQQVSIQISPNEAAVIGIKNGGKSGSHAGLQWSDVTNSTVFRFALFYTV